MRIGRYKIKFSERGKHYMEMLGGLLCIAIMIISAIAVLSWAVADAEGEYDNLKVGHIYEDNCIDLYDTETKEYYFYCEDSTFYGGN